MLDQSGLLVGVVVQKLDAIKMAKITGDIPQNINFAIKGDVAQIFLDSSGVRYEKSASNTNLTNVELASKGKKLTVLVLCTQ